MLTVTKYFPKFQQFNGLKCENYLKAKVKLKY